MSSSRSFSDKSVWIHTKLLLLLLLVCLFVLHWNTIGFLFTYWWDSSTYGHGILVFPLSIFLIWKKRSELDLAQYSPSLLGLFLFVLFGIGWWAGYWVDVAIIKQLAFFGMVGAIFWSMLGWRTTSIYLLPLVLPLFALPLWSPLTPLLQYLTTQAVSFSLSLIGIPIYVEDHFIHIPEGKFSIEEVCAGLRYVLAAVLVALVYVYLHIHQLRSRLVFVGSVILLSLIVNWIRVFVVILAGHLTNMTHSFVTDHADFGWWLFAFTLIPIFWFGGYLVNKEQKTARRQDASDPEIQNDTAHNVSINNSSARYVFPALLIFMLIIPLSGFYLKERNRQVLDSPLIDLQAPKPSGQWSGPYEVQQNSVQPVFQGSDREVIASYKKDGNEAILYMAQYLFQEQGKELIAEYNRPYNTSIWRPVSNGKRQIKLPDGSIIEAREVIIKNEQGKTQILWYWYSIAGINTISPVEAKILQMRDLLSRSKSGSTIILLILNTDHNTDSARNIMTDYYSNMYDALYATIYKNLDFTRQSE